MTDRVAYDLNAPVRSYGDAGNLKIFGGTFSLLTSDLTLNRQTGLFRVPQGFRPWYYMIAVTDLDTNATPAIVFSIGEDGNLGRILNNSTGAQAGLAFTTIALTAAQFTYAADTEITFTVTTAAATAAAGTITLMLVGDMV